MPLIVFLIFVYGLVGLAKEVTKEGASRATGRGGPQRSGLSDYLDEAWHGFWEHKAAALAAARNAKDLNGDGRVSWRERWAAARAVLKRGSGAAKKAGRWLVAPVGETAPTTKVREEESMDEPLGPVNDRDVADLFGTHDCNGDCTDGDCTNRGRRPAPASPARPAPTHGGPAMTAPSPGSAGHAAEANNYEAALRKLNELGGRVDGQQDRAAGARNYLDRVDDIIDAVEQEQRRLAAETQQMAEALTAVHLDPSTLAGMAAANEALDPNALAECVQYVEALKAAMQKVIAGCDTARGAIAATRQQIMAKYGDAHDVVQSQLSGDATFLQGEGGTAAAPASQPARQPVTAGRPAA
jgi:hypothetical protein